MKIIHTSGKRKSAIARATLTEGSGIIRVNSKNLEIYEPKMYKLKIMEPLMLAQETAKKVNISVDVIGGGQSSQSDAVRLAIGKALVQYQSSLKKVFLQYDRSLIVADIRRREAYKPNDSKARAKRQKSYR